MKETPLKKALRVVGSIKLGKACGVSYQSILGWERTGSVPRSEWTGETSYCEAIEAATTEAGDAVTKKQLIDWSMKNNLKKRSKK